MTSLEDKYSATYFGRLGNCISQLGHTISGGAADVSISGKTGYKYLNTSSKLWKFNKSLIDFSFKPVDGKDHCVRAYLVDKEEKYHVGEGIYQDVICSIFVLLICPIVALLAYPIKGVINLFK